MRRSNDDRDQNYISSSSSFLDTHNFDLDKSSTSAILPKSSIVWKQILLAIFITFTIVLSFMAGALWAQSLDDPSNVYSSYYNGFVYFIIFIFFYNLFIYVNP